MDDDILVDPSDCVFDYGVGWITSFGYGFVNRTMETIRYDEQESRTVYHDEFWYDFPLLAEKVLMKTERNSDGLG